MEGQKAAISTAVGSGKSQAVPSQPDVQSWLAAGFVQMEIGRQNGPVSRVENGSRPQTNAHPRLNTLWTKTEYLHL